MSEGKFGVCCCVGNRVSVRSLVWFYGFRPPEAWMIGTWTYNGSSATGTGPGSPPNAAAILAAMEIINDLVELYHFPYNNMARTVSSQGDFETLYQTMSTEATLMIKTGGVEGDTQWNDKSWTLDYRGHVLTRKYGKGSYGGANPVGEYEYVLNADGTTTITDNEETAFYGPGGMGGSAWAYDTSGAVTTIVVTATTLQIDQVTTNPPGHPDTIYTAHYKCTWSSAITATAMMKEAIALLAEKSFVGAAEGCYLVQWVWAEGTARAKQVTADPTYADPNWPWAWRHWAISSDGHFSQAVACKVHVHVTEELFGEADPDLKRSEQTIFAPNTLASWATGYPNGTPATWTGTYELIEGYYTLGEWVSLVPALIGQDIPESYDGYDFGKAEIVEAT